MFNVEKITDSYLNSGVPNNLIEPLQALMLTLNEYALDLDEIKTIQSLYSAIGMNEIKTSIDLKAENWQEFDYGNARPGDFIRVKDTAYEYPFGKLHNGRVGILIDVFARRCKVRYLGMASGEEIRHPESKLQSLKYDVKLKTNQKQKDD